MNICIKKSIKSWTQKHPKTTQWLWFVGLGASGLAFVLTATYPIKLLIRAMK